MQRPGFSPAPAGVYVRICAQRDAPNVSDGPCAERAHRGVPMAVSGSAPQVTNEQLRIRGLQVHIQMRGEGEPLLLYSGIWGEVGLWERLLPHFDGFRTIAFDPPGIGSTQMPRVPMTMWGLADFGTAVLDELDVPSAHVLGASFGGAVAQQMAVTHSGRGGRLRTEPELVRSMHIQRPKNPWQAVYRMAPLFGWTSLPWLWAIRHPTLIVAGDDDPVTPHLNHRLMAALIPRAQLHTVRGGGHLALIDSAAEVAPVIASFLHADSGAAQDASDPRAAAFRRADRGFR